MFNKETNSMRYLETDMKEISKKVVESTCNSPKRR